MSEEKNCKAECFKSKIGGQALIEGVYMRGITTAAMACRLPDGTIDLEQWAVKNGKDAPWYRKTPFVRGCINFVASLVEGIRCTMKSAEKQIGDDEEEEELSKFEQWLTDKFGDKLVNVIMIISVVIALAFSLVVFKGGPILIANLIEKLGAPESARPVIEGFVRLALVVGYMYAISFMGSIKTTFMYHGAEHKTIACYEAREALTVENVKKHTRFHPRCGTSFILIVLIISVIVGIFLPRNNMWIRFGVQMLCLIPEAAVAYEVIKLAGRFDNVLTRIVSAPGLWLQRITTKEPNDKQIEVAIAALEPCLPKEGEEDKW
ncbi:MAG: DUF1385 domain-containing protein [Oscillospiraceae bacterium]|nr:DUF1385 domain-containing protein [Oscillospiraceae bacterium]